MSDIIMKPTWNLRSTGATEVSMQAAESCVKPEMASVGEADEVKELGIYHFPS
jgi:hypothetical protein